MILIASYISLISCIFILINEWSKGFKESRTRIKYSIILWHIATVANIVERDYLIAALFAFCAMLSIRKLHEYDNRKDNTDKTN